MQERMASAAELAGTEGTASLASAGRVSTQNPPVPETLSSISGRLRQAPSSGPPVSGHRFAVS